MPYMEESHRLDLDNFSVEVRTDGEGKAEVLFSLADDVLFRADTHELKTALDFVEKHGDIAIVSR